MEGKEEGEEGGEAPSMVEGLGCERGMMLGRMRGMSPCCGHIMELNTAYMAHGILKVKH